MFFNKKLLHVRCKFESSKRLFLEQSSNAEVMKQSNKLNFKGESIYCGIDVHARQWTVCIRDRQFELKKFTQPPEADKLSSFLKRTYPGANYYAVYEAGFCGFWPQRQLQAAGIKCMVTHAADVPSTDKEKREKTDPVDCRKLARSLCNGDLKSIYIPSATKPLRGFFYLGGVTVFICNP